MQLNTELTRGDSMNVADRYVELIKDALSFSLWQEIGFPMETYEHERNPVLNGVLCGISAGIKPLGYKVVQAIPYSDADRVQGMVWPSQAHTMIGRPRLDNLQFCVDSVLAKGVAGDLIETGVWRGGASIFMRAILAARDERTRRVFVADSFEGLPRPDPAKYPHDRWCVYHTFKNLAVSLEDVQSNFKSFGLLDDQVVFLKGWFKDTLPTAPIKQLAVMRLDGDMYQSTTEALEALYPKLSAGGFCIIDDYGLEGCKLAVDDFRGKYGITAPLVKIDWSGVFWQR